MNIYHNAVTRQLHIDAGSKQITIDLPPLDREELLYVMQSDTVLEIIKQLIEKEVK